MIGNMSLRCRVLLVALLLSAGFSCYAENNLRATENLTPLDEYVAAPDDNFRFELVHTHQGKGWKGHVLHMVSQSWLTPDKVDRTLWEHWLVIMVPDKPAHETAMLLIGGGNNGGEMPRGADANLRRIVQETNTVAAQIHQVPNQPLVFADDGRRRVEDAIIAHNWDSFCARVTRCGSPACRPERRAGHGRHSGLLCQRGRRQDERWKLRGCRRPSAGGQPGPPPP